MRKLSELIREGAKQHPKCTKVYAHISVDGVVESTCALGAAKVAAGIRPYKTNLKLLDEIIGYDIYYETVIHPVTGKEDKVISQVIVELNDEYDWTREAVADWLESEGR